MISGGRPTTISTLVVVALLALLLGGSAARGQDSRPPPAVAPASPAPAALAVQARDRYQRGLAHFQLDEFAPALEDFKEAYRLYPDATLLFDIAQCHRKLGADEQALSFYKKFLAARPDAPNRAEVTRRIDELERALAAKASPPRAGRPARADAAAGRSARSSEPVPAPAVDTAPAAGRAGGGDGPAWRRLALPQVAGVAAGALGVIGFGVSAAFAIHAVHKRDESSGGCTGDVCNPAGAEARRAAVSAADSATFAFVAGAVLVAGGVTAFVLGRPKDGERGGGPRFTLAPATAAGGPGLIVAGRF